MDLLLFNTIINTVWYVFTALFILYKYTSFFSYGYNFVRFCGKAWTGATWLYDKSIAFVQTRWGSPGIGSYAEVDLEANVGQRAQPTFLQRCFKQFQPAQQETFPLHESQRESFIHTGHASQSSYPYTSFGMFTGQPRPSLYDPYVASHDSGSSSSTHYASVNEQHQLRDSNVLLHDSFISTTLKPFSGNMPFVSHQQLAKNHYMRTTPYTSNSYPLFDL